MNLLRVQFEEQWANETFVHGSEIFIVFAADKDRKRTLGCKEEQA